MSLLTYTHEIQECLEINEYIQQLGRTEPVRILMGQLQKMQIQEEKLQEIWHLHEMEEEPELESKMARKTFLNKASQYYLTPDGWLFWRNGTKSPLLVILNPEIQNWILLQAQDKLGHKGE